jgi:hypothetical protein
MEHLELLEHQAHLVLREQLVQQVCLQEYQEHQPQMVIIF